MIRNAVTRASAVVLCAATCLILTGCTPIDPVLARLSDGALQFKVCDTVSAQEVSVTSGPVEGIDYTLKWRAQGDSLVTSGDIVNYGEPPAGWQSISGPRELVVAGAGVNFRIGAVVGDTNSSDALLLSATFNGDKMDGEWRDAQGNARDCGDF